MIDLARHLTHATPIEPGVYDVITDSSITGLIAHEAFGHGVEMDMFVKGRALGAEYIGKRVGSDLVTMHEGALCAEDVTSYAFDDEGIPAGDVTEIKNGILQTGICDALSALRLGVKPTGNGKRENFAHKVYTRMTNTVFDSGDSTLEEMIAGIKDNPSNKNGVVGKLIEGYRWVLAAVVDNSDKIYQLDDRVTLKFASTSEMIRGTITALNMGNDPGQTVALITCDAMTYDLVQHRTDTVEIIRGEYQGIRVPRSALHFKEIENEEGRMETVRGVYILNGEQPEFRMLMKPENGFYEGDDYVIAAQTTDSDYLMLYDSIITKGIDADGQ